MGEQINNKIDMISLSLTNRCNLNCKMCWQKTQRTESAQKIIDLPYDNFLVILEALKKLSPNNIYLWGGEPLLHSRIIDIIHEVKKNGFLSHLITNGLLLNERVDELIKARLDTISISIDGVGHTHDTIRGLNGAYDRIIMGVKTLLAKRKVRPIVSINTVITDENYQHLYEIVKELSYLNVNGLQLQFPVHFNFEEGEQSADYLKNEFNLCSSLWKGFVKSYQAIDVVQLDRSLMKIKKDFPKIMFYPPNQTATSWFNKKINSASVQCFVPWKRVNIEPNGDMTICTDYADMVAGNLLEADFDAIWNNNIYRKFRSNIANGKYMPICKHCTYSHLSWGKK